MVESMIVFKNEQTILVDIDETMIMHTKSIDIPLKDLVYVQDPVEPGIDIPLRINQPMVRCFKEEYQRGSLMLVMSRGGYEWAANVIKALKLDLGERVIVTSKPKSYFDDKEVSEWLKDRVYITPDTVYKTANKT